MAEVDQAVQRVRTTQAYRLLVVGYRCLLVAPVMLVVAIALTAVWSLKPPLVYVPLVMTFATVFTGVITLWVGLIVLHSRRLMPTWRHRPACGGDESPATGHGRADQTPATWLRLAPDTDPEPFDAGG
ncbi:hypothetical protein SAMN05443287_12310 [Micromonospora phaseoli]|uniref:Uncharacterized protein n=1 Tax=Micromonospora phaseoli TaxID=1144548 RepID=A0A1H7DYZ1_9ACTN|nr:hypothetical protein CLV64_12017 [Micromonospora phaseoli]SEK06963.1 hypothetical protein SAMN05443287_12310 [Micromonospora phaseoli]